MELSPPLRWLAAISVMLVVVVVGSGSSPGGGTSAVAATDASTGVVASPTNPSRPGVSPPATPPRPRPTRRSPTPPRRDDHTVSVAMGKAALVTHGVNLRQVSISDPSVAEAVVVSPNEVLVNGKKMGSTSLVLWDASGRRELHSIEVTADAQALQRQFSLLFPGEDLRVQASGNTFVLSGSVSDASVERRAIAIASSVAGPEAGDRSVASSTCRTSSTATGGGVGSGLVSAIVPTASVSTRWPASDNRPYSGGPSARWIPDRPCYRRADVDVRRGLA